MFVGIVFTHWLSVIAQLCEMTGRSEEDVIVALHDAQDDADRAVMILLEGGQVVPNALINWLQARLVGMWFFFHTFFGDNCVRVAVTTREDGTDIFSREDRI